MRWLQLHELSESQFEVLLKRVERNEEETFAPGNARQRDDQRKKSFFLSFRFALETWQWQRAAAAAEALTKEEIDENSAQAIDLWAHEYNGNRIQNEIKRRSKKSFNREFCAMEPSFVGMELLSCSSIVDIVHCRNHKKQKMEKMSGIRDHLHRLLERQTRFHGFRAECKNNWTQIKATTKCQHGKLRHETHRSRVYFVIESNFKSFVLAAAEFVFIYVLFLLHFRSPIRVVLGVFFQHFVAFAWLEFNAPNEWNCQSLIKTSTFSLLPIASVRFARHIT